MKISAQIRNASGRNEVMLRTNDHAHRLVVPPKATGAGSSVNGGELLFLALATCYCNDVYREAAKRGIVVTEVEVFVDGEFEAEGAPATRVSYRAKVTAKGDEAAIRALMLHTDRVAEIHNTLRTAVPVELSSIEVTAAWQTVGTTITPDEPVPPERRQNDREGGVAAAG